MKKINILLFFFLISNLSANQQLNPKSIFSNDLFFQEKVLLATKEAKKDKKEVITNLDYFETFSMQDSPYKLLFRKSQHVKTIKVGGSFADACDSPLRILFLAGKQVILMDNIKEYLPDHLLLVPDLKSPQKIESHFMAQYLEYLKAMALDKLVIGFNASRASSVNNIHFHSFTYDKLPVEHFDLNHKYGNVYKVSDEFLEENVYCVINSDEKVVLNDSMKLIEEMKKQEYVANIICRYKNGTFYNYLHFVKKWQKAGLLSTSGIYFVGNFPKQFQNDNIGYFKHLTKNINNLIEFLHSQQLLALNREFNNIEALRFAA